MPRAHPYLLGGGRVALDKITIAAGGGGPVAFDAVGPSSTAAQAGPAASSITFSHTCGAGATILVVGFVVSGGDTSTSTHTCTYNGVSMTPAGALLLPGSTSSATRIFYLLNPTTGSAQNVVITRTAGNGDNWIAGAVSFTGATGVSGYSTATADQQNSPAFSVISTTSSMVFALFAHGASITGGNGTVRTSRNVSTNYAGDNLLISTHAGATTVSPTSTSGGGDHWICSGLSIDP